MREANTGGHTGHDSTDGKHPEQADLETGCQELGKGIRVIAKRHMLRSFIFEVTKCSKLMVVMAATLGMHEKPLKCTFHS